MIEENVWIVRQGCIQIQAIECVILADQLV